MMKSILLLICFAAANAVNLIELAREEFYGFKAEHNKVYESKTEENFRQKIFHQNRNYIANHNRKYHQGLVSFKLGLNKYADLLHYEFVKTLNGYNRSAISSESREEGATFISPANVLLPKTVDWREKGAITEVKDQGHCGSCWAFSTTGALEAYHFRKTGSLVSLSEQNLIDCSTSFGNNGCNGGLMDNAFRYIKSNGGIDTEKAYPYEGMDDSCHFEKSAIGATDKGFVDIPEGNEKKMVEAVATLGPVSVAIDASHQSFQFYHSGVYMEPECDSKNLDHGVLVVGYGTDESGQDYWLVKNSWGTSWGDHGYIKMARNQENNCGIASSASYPLV